MKRYLDVVLRIPLPERTTSSGAENIIHQKLGEVAERIKIRRSWHILEFDVHEEQEQECRSNSSGQTISEPLTEERSSL